jgi:DNA processing protein
MTPGRVGRPSGALEEERLARAALCRLTEPGDPRLSSLVSELGATTVRDHLLAERDVSGLATDIAARLAVIDPRRDLDLARRGGFRFLVPGDADWPDGCDDLATPAPVQQRGGVPLGLWVRGRLPEHLGQRSVAVVGSRSATTYGADTAGAMAALLAREGFAVVSGAAYGIDQAAHRGALAVDGPTVAVLACGVDRAYPAAHRALIDHIAEVGAVVSEVAPGCSPTRLRFLARNRLIAALTRGTVVVEAAVRSGALNTANWAERLNRPLMGVPGPVTSAPSQGVHQIIRSGAATLVTHAVDVMELIAPAGEHLLAAPRGPSRPRDALSLRQQQVLDAVPVARAAGTDSIARTAGIGLVEVRSTLGRLATQGLVRSSEAGWVLAPGIDE